MSDKDKSQEKFEDLMGGVRRTPSRRLHLQGAPPAATASFTRADERAVMQESLSGHPDHADTGEELAYRGGVGEKVWRQLRRGRLAVEDEVDLHGLSAAAARDYLAGFLAHARQRGLRCVRVVHGKGKRSGQRGPVLKVCVDRWLRRWSGIAAFCSARPVDGGTGAVYVLLKRP